jgi:hypothetical protein
VEGIFGSGYATRLPNANFLQEFDARRFAPKRAGAEAKPGLPPSSTRRRPPAHPLPGRPQCRCRSAACGPLGARQRQRRKRSDALMPHPRLTPTLTICCGVNRCYIGRLIDLSSRRRKSGPFRSFSHHINSDLHPINNSRVQHYLSDIIGADKRRFAAEASPSPRILCCDLVLPE